MATAVAVATEEVDLQPLSPSDEYERRKAVNIVPGSGRQGSGCLLSGYGLPVSP